MKKIIAIIVILGGAFSGFLYLHRKPNGESLAAEGPPTAEATRDSIRVSVECTGSIVSNLDVEIKCEAGGEIISLPYDVSDAVKQGDLLAELDPEKEERNVRKERVSLLSAQARLLQASHSLRTAEQELIVETRRARAALESASAPGKDARAKAERMKALLESDRVSAEENETAQTAATVAAVALENAEIAIEKLKVDEEALDIQRQEVRQAEASFESAVISLEIAEERLEDTKVYAPISGVIAARNVETGQIISSALSNVGGGTTLFILSDLSRVFIVASVDESDIGKVKEGQSVEITVDAFPNEPFWGEVERIATKGVNVSNVVTFEVKIEVLGPNKSRLKPEMTANVEILVAESENTVLLPIEAVQRTPEGSFVLLPGPEGESPRPQEVKTGVENGADIEIVDGVEEGTVVLLPRSSWMQGEGRTGWSEDYMRRRVMRQMGMGPPHIH